MMTDERYKAIMAELGQPHSHSLLAALRQVANEVAQEVQAAERERLMCGDYFTHDRTGARFICRAVTRHDYGGSMSMLRAEIELAPK